MQNGFVVLTNEDDQKFWRHASSYSSIPSDYVIVAPFWTDVDFLETIDVEYEVISGHFFVSKLNLLILFPSQTCILHKVGECSTVGVTILAFCSRGL